MAQTEQIPLLTNVEETTLPPPPPYQPTQSEEKKVQVEPVVKPVYEADKVLPLPTYDQSQKYEHDGVLDLEEDDETEEVSHIPVRLADQKLPGTCLDFTLFFFLVSFFGVIGFIFSICFAFTIAAESGALAGLGLTFVSNLVAFEIHDKMHIYGKGCEVYFNNGGDTRELELCTRRLLYLTRILFWLLGVFGFFLLIKGCHRYVVTRRQRVPVVHVTDSE